jgi:cyclopropane fatty-acyl-phospholipid synthase-like methyltransferase
MKLRIKKIISKIPIIGLLVRALYVFLNDKILNLFFQFFPSKGKIYYSNMQKENYKKYTENFLDTKNLCVGNFNAQESYPYKEYLLEHFKGNKKTALDFACGMGRMMLHMSNEFEVVDGVDLSQNNLAFAKKYLSENNLPSKRYNLYLSDGLSVDIPKKI